MTMQQQAQQRMPTPGPKDVANGGVIHPRELAKFEDDGANNVGAIYGDKDTGKGIGIVMWCLKPGQENSMQWHETISHVFIVTEGEGVYTKGEPLMAPVEAPKEVAPEINYKCKEVPIKSGDIIFIPERTIHGIRNTGRTNLAYVAVSLGENYTRINVGPQVPPHRRPGAGPRAE